MTKQPSRSSALIAAMHFAALSAMNAAPNGQLKKNDISQAIKENVDLDEWALELYDNGSERWRSIFSLASVELVKGGYVTKASGTWTITDEGRAVVNAPYDGQAFIAELYKRYQAWKNSQLSAETNQATLSKPEDEDEVAPEPPDVRMSAIQNESNEALSAELLETIKAAPAVNFERLVVNLLMKMGYGGNRANAGKVTQASGDNGIDGIINEDPLGLDTIYLQAKRWQEPVGEAPVRDFIGALDIKGVKKGVFLTTSHFTKPAWEAVTSIKSDKKVILIEGARLAALMIEHNLGVSTAQTFALKRLDTDFFEED